LAQATYIVLTKPLVARYRALDVASWAMWSGAIVALPLIPLIDTNLGQVSGEGWAAVVYLGVVPSALGFVFWGRALVDAPAPVVASALYFVPPVTAVVAWIWIDETPGPQLIVGGTVVLVGVYLVNRYGRASSATSASASRS
jgi:drug/metabolite transporter (DMT)-like permease